MALVITADRPDELPESLRASAKEVNGKFVVSELPAGVAIENVQGLKNALGNERGTVKILADKCREFGWTMGADGAKWSAEGLPPVEAAKALESLKSGTLKSPKEIEDYKAQLTASYEQEKQKGTALTSKLRSQLEAVLIDQAATAALSKAGGGGSLRALLPLAKQAAKVEESADGSLRVVLYGTDGRQRFSSKNGAAGAAMSFEEFAEELRESQDLRPLFVTKATGGSGAASQGGGTARTAGVDLTQLSGAALLAMANEGQA